MVPVAREMDMLRSSRIATVGAGVAAALVLSVVPATAVPPRSGATYSGHVAGAPSSQDAVTFVVSDNGKWVRRMHVGPWPLSGSCGSGGDRPHQSAQPAHIRKGTFTAHVVYRTDAGDVMARATVTGTFLRNGREKGVVSTHRISDSCDTSLPYTTQAQ